MNAQDLIGNLISGRTPVDFFDITFDKTPEGFGALRALVESRDFRFSLPSHEEKRRMDLLLAASSANWERVGKDGVLRCFLSDVMPKNSAAYNRFMDKVAPYVKKLVIGEQRFERK